MAIVGVVVGCVIGGLFLFGAAIVLYIYYCRHRARPPNADERVDHIEDGEDLDPVPVFIGSSTSGNGHQSQQRQQLLSVKRRKMDYIVDAVLNKAYPKEKEPATVQTCGIHVVDHHFVHGAIDR